jgi:DEAD/DEAH box helicase domain-containing protein
VSLCDRGDIGGASLVEHPDTGMPTIFIYDGYSGGAGFTHHGFDAAREWLGATLETIAQCSCAEGCPACVQSPKCGNNNNPLDKSAAARLLEHVLSA